MVYFTLNKWLVIIMGNINIMINIWCQIIKKIYTFLYLGKAENAVAWNVFILIAVVLKLQNNNGC